MLDTSTTNTESNMNISALETLNTNCVSLLFCSLYVIKAGRWNLLCYLCKEKKGACIQCSVSCIDV